MAAACKPPWSRALGRRVEIGKVHFSLFKGPGFSVDNVTIYEDPAIGMEPVVYIQEPGSMEVAPSIWSLLGGKFVIASIRLDGASINLTKSGPASEWGRWNFSSIVNPSVIRTAPAIHVRDSRIHFKFGDTKSVFYLTETDLDLSPSASSGDWKIACSAKPARADRPAQGLGSFTLKGRWYAEPGRVDLDMEVDRAALGEVTALMSGQDAGVHGTLSSRLHLAGPLNNMGITGRLDIGDVHRWDMMPGNSQGWRQEIRGRLDLIGQQLELHSTTAGNATLPLAVHFRATDYLSQPHWAVGLNWNRFPVAPILELARHMGAQFPPKLQLTGTMDGAIVYAGQGSLQGALAFHDTALGIPDSPAVRFEQAHIILGNGHARLSPALVRGGENDEARLEADYALDSQTLDLAISTDAMKVQSLRAQVALAAVPWLEQIAAGQWSGDLHYHRAAAGRSRLERPPRAHRCHHRHPRPGRPRPVKLRARPDRWRPRGAGSHRRTGGQARLHRRLPLRTRRGAPASPAPARRKLGRRRSRSRVDAHPAPQHQPDRARPRPADGYRLAAPAQSRWHRADRRPSGGRRPPGKLPRARAYGT